MTLTDTTFLTRYGTTPSDVAEQLRAALQDFEAALQRTHDRWFTPVGEHLNALGERSEYHLAWSPAQQAEHVLKANSSFSKVIHLLGSDRELPVVPRARGTLSDGQPVAPDLLQPGPGVAWAQLETPWRAANERLLQEIERIDPDSDRVFWHPFLQDLSALDWARSAVLHTRRHRKQLGVS